jgi:putative phosphoesterase
MKTIVAFSDSHNRTLPQKFKAVLDEADFVFFLGDGLRGLAEYFQRENFYAVKGNCDALPFPEEMEVTVEGVKFWLTHGHNYSAKYDMHKLLLRALEKGANCALFGHTHIPETVFEQGVHLINPGSITLPRIGNPSYAYITVSGQKMFCKIVEAVCP